MYLSGEVLLKHWSLVHSACIMATLFLMAQANSPANSLRVAAEKSVEKNWREAIRLESDCSGTMAFAIVGNPRSETHWDLYVANGGNKGHIIRMDEGNMAVRSFEK